MKTRFFGLAGLVLLLLLPAAAEQRPAETAASSRHSLWKVAGQHNTVYLLGAVHFLKQTDYPLPAPIEAAFTNAQIAVFEADLDKLEDLETQAKLLKLAQLPEGQTLKQLLSTNTYADFKQRLEQAGLPEFPFEHLKPALAAITLEVFAMQQAGLDPQYGLDRHFFKLAREAGKQVVGLESVDFQIGLITGFSAAESDLIMKTTLKDIDNTKTMLDELMQSWRLGDDQALQKLLNHAMGDAPAIFKRLVSDRNRQWLPKVEEWVHGEKNVIVIVGAGHLVGKEGLVQLLKDKGLTVVQE